LKNSCFSRVSIRPARSNAAIVFANVGAAGSAPIASISDRCSASAASNAGSKCSGRSAPNGGRPYGVFQRCSSGLSDSLPCACRCRHHLPLRIMISSFSS
jgi:hypothetical protein